MKNLVRLSGLTIVLQDHEHTRTKGVPGVAIYVKRGEDVFLWKQVDPRRQDDRICLNVDGHGLGYVRIVSERGETLYEGELTPDKATLPLSWRRRESLLRQSLSTLV